MAQLTPAEAAALHMRNADPQAFEDFTKQLEILVEKALDAMLTAPPEAVQLSQGTARGLRVILRIFKECTIERPKPGAPVAPL
ncbi:MAG TPA: hypothetical protein VMS08_00285 [Candidatus Saccharimonadia bacterium]|nr:hypothetical protein [Candidatus Saccharimonadia bacterium]